MKTRCESTVNGLYWRVECMSNELIRKSRDCDTPYRKLVLYAMGGIPQSIRHEENRNGKVANNLMIKKEQKYSDKKGADDAAIKKGADQLAIEMYDLISEFRSPMYTSSRYY